MLKYINELRNGTRKKATLYEINGQKIVLLQALKESKQRVFLWKTRREANITQRLSCTACDIRTVHVKRLKGSWEVSGNYVEGEEFDKALYDSLPEDEKKQLIENMAEFLFQVHLLNVSQMDEHYADESDDEGFLYFFLKFCYKVHCFMKTYFSLKKYGKSPYGTHSFARKRKKLYSRLSLSSSEIERMEKVSQTVCEHPEIFAYVCVCFGDISSANFVYNQKSKRLGVFDFDCLYKGHLYIEFALVLIAWGADFTQRTINTYNLLASQRDMHLPKCNAYPVQIHYPLVQHLAALFLFEHEKKEELLELLQGLYP